MATENKGGIDYAAVLADLKSKKIAIEESIKWIEAMMKGTVPSGGFGSSHVPNHADMPKEIKDDTFFNKTVTDATKLFLSMSPRNPKSTMEITDALQRGGLPDTSAGTVTTILSRNAKAKRIFSKHPKKKWGLLEWYNEPKKS